jgi:hypothetical protein
MGKKVRIRDEQPGAYFLELREPLFWEKILTFFDADPGWKKVGSGINIPDPQHCQDETLARWALFHESAVQFVHCVYVSIMQCPAFM